MRTKLALLAFAACLLVLCLAGPALAAGGPAVFYVWRNGGASSDFWATLSDGWTYTLSTSPKGKFGSYSYDILYHAAAGRFVVPVRPVAEALGAQVAWDSERQAAIVRTNEHELEIRPGEKTYLIDGTPVEKDLAPYLSSDILHIPVRHLADALGWQVHCQWIEPSRPHNPRAAVVTVWRGGPKPAMPEDLSLWLKSYGYVEVAPEPNAKELKERLADALKAVGGERVVQAETGTVFGRVSTGLLAGPYDAPWLALQPGGLVREGGLRFVEGVPDENDLAAAKAALRGALPAEAAEAACGLMEEGYRMFGRLLAASSPEDLRSAEDSAATIALPLPGRTEWRHRASREVAAGGYRLAVKVSLGGVVLFIRPVGGS